MKRAARGLLVVLTAAAAACDRPAEARFSRGADTVPDKRALTVDSILPAGEALRRFQADVVPATELTNGARGRDDLVTRFVAAVEKADTVALRNLVVSKSEYAFLYYPGSLYTKKPYELAPDIAWLLGEQSSLKGFTRLTRRLGGKTLNFTGYQCSEPFIEGGNRFWRTCHVQYTDPASGSPVNRKLFSAIMERDGSYKFLSYANDF